MKTDACLAHELIGPNTPGKRQKPKWISQRKVPFHLAPSKGRRFSCSERAWGRKRRGWEDRKERKECNLSFLKVPFSKDIFRTEPHPLQAWWHSECVVSYSPLSWATFISTVKTINWEWRSQCRAFFPLPLHIVHSSCDGRTTAARLALWRDRQSKEEPALIESVADRCDYSLFMVPIRLYRFQMMTVVGPSFPPSLCFPVIPCFTLVYLIFFCRLSAFLFLLISPFPPFPRPCSLPELCPFSNSLLK